MNAADARIYTHLGDRIAVMKGFIGFNLANQALEIIITFWR